MSDYILCPRVKDTPLDDFVDDATKTVCAFCGEEVWISPNGEKFRKKTGLDVICVRCMKDRSFAPEEMPPIVQAIATFMGMFQKFLEDTEERARKAAEARREEIRNN